MDKIAIVGLSTLFPKADNPDAFWQNLLAQKDCRSTATAEKMGIEPNAYLGNKGDVDKFYCTQGGFIEGFDFSAQGYQLPENYLSQLDDLCQWVLHTGKTALEHAGIDDTARKNCGVILGNLSFPTKSSNHLFMPMYHHALQTALQKNMGSAFALNNFSHASDTHSDNGLIAGKPAALVSQALGLGAHFYALDAACASSCYALKLACDALQTGKADVMLAGAVSAADPTFVHMGFSIFQAYPANQISAPLDSRSQGLFAGEGAGMMVLKRHGDALRDCDTIHAIIEGGALSNDGKGEFVLSPNSKGQVLAYQRAYQDAQVSPADVAYIECHATGTPKGDKVELTSMERFFSENNAPAPLIGSVKSNLGHLLTAAGMAGVTKSIYALREQKIPATIHLEQAMGSPSAYFSANNIPVQTVDFPARNNKPLAGVSVFGFGGADAHLVLSPAASELKQSNKKLNLQEPMAIVGMDGHFAKAQNIHEIAHATLQQQSQLCTLPESRWSGMQNDTKLMHALDNPEKNLGGYIEDFEVDFLHFKVPPNEKDSLIPQQLLMMKVADNAVQDAKLKEGGNVAVLVAMGVELELHQYRGRVNLQSQIEQSLLDQGITLSDSERQAFTDIAKTCVADAAQLNQYTSFIGNIMASRISALWDFSGPAMTVSSEENSVYRCLDLADTLFQTSDVEAVVIAAVDLAGSLENIRLRKSRMQHGQDKLQVADGAGAFVVKPASKVTEAYATISCPAFTMQTSSNALADNFSKLSINANNIDAVQLYNSGLYHDEQAETSFVQQHLPNAQCLSAKSLFGHSFNASGMLDVLSAAIAANAGSKQTILLNGLGADEAVAQTIVQQYLSAKNLFTSTDTGKKKLLKRVVLGGKHIFNEAEQQRNTLKIMAQKMQVKGQVTSPIALPVLPLLNNNLSNHASHTSSQETVMTNRSPSNQQPWLKVQAHHDAHAAFMEARNHAQKHLADLIALQNQLQQGGVVASVNAIAANIPQTHASQAHIAQPTQSIEQVVAESQAELSPGITLTEQFNQPQQIIFNTDDLVEFAEGDIGKVFGSEYDIIDTYSRRVRLPTTDYLLVTRVTDLDAKVHEFKPCSMATEYDIPVDAPFLIDGQIPWSVSVESGQCDLMLISYLGIDFQAKGERVYRLLDCELTFLGDMAFGGQTLRYEIKIDSYAKNGDQLLFFFHYDCFVGGKKVLIMRNGCAGFFTDQELDEGKGVILNDKDKAELSNAKKTHFDALITNDKYQFGYDDIMHLVNGDIAKCMGPAYDQQGRNPSLKFSSKKFLMIEQVTSIQPQAGHWGLGVLEGKKRLEPDHWYFPCHFKDDQVMAGSLMSEGCGQLAMFYMLWLGMHKDMVNARFQPVPGESQTVRCRGQVTPQSNDLTYRMEVTEMGMEPYPYLKANIDIILDGKVVVDFKNLSVMIKEQDPNSQYAADLPASVQALPSSVQSVAKANVNSQLDETGKAAFSNVNAPLMWVETDTDAAKIKGVKPIKHVPAPMPTDPAKQNRVPNQAPFTPWHLFEFATGDIGLCFGEKFNVYHNRIPPRTPCGDLQLVTQVVEVQGERFDLKNPSSCVAEYEVPADAWYFSKNSHHTWMPYSILMEISLQPNGFISGYMGTTLKYPEKDLFFRNLDGTGKLLKQIDLRGKTIVNKSVLLNTSVAGGSIIQSFSFDLLCDGEVFYQGSAVFGYFGSDALANQLGIDNGKTTKPWFVNEGIAESSLVKLDLTDSNFALYKPQVNKPYYRLAGGQMNFVDTVTIANGGGDYQQGYIYGERTIDPSDWFFRYHFHQDPVMPGSLGVEAIIELLQTYALHHDLGAQFTNPRFIAPLTEVVWKYRGQITPENRQMSLDVHIKAIEKTTDEVRVIGDANLSKDGLRIYHVKDIVLSIIEA